jgi:hypothetical protein
MTKRRLLGQGPPMAGQQDVLEREKTLSYLKMRLAFFGPLISGDHWKAFLNAEESVGGIGECLKALPLHNRIILKQFLVQLQRLKLDNTLLAITVLAPALANDMNFNDVCVQLKRSS